MKIKVFSPDENFPRNSVIIADFRNVPYDKEDETIQAKTAKKYGIDLYPIVTEINDLVLKILTEEYANCIWYIDQSLF